MKPSALLLAVAVVSAVLPGCASIQSPAVVSAVQKIQTKQHAADMLVDDMSKLFEGVVGELPEADRAAYRTAFSAQVERYRALSLSASQALDAALETQSESPDMAKIGRLLVDAARGVYDAFRTFGGPKGIVHDEPAKLARVDAALTWLEEHP